MASLKKDLFLGLCLSGVKKDKSKLIVLENYKDLKKLIISKVDAKFKNGPLQEFPDELLIHQIKSYRNIKYIGVNAPTFAPPCASCKLKCQGVESCQVNEVKWLKREYARRRKKGTLSEKEYSMPVPYIERGLDYYTAYLLEEEFPFEPAFAPNRQIFYSRLKFINKRVDSKKMVECSTKASLWRIGRRLGIRKSLLRQFYKGDKAKENKALFLKSLEKEFFLYEEDKSEFIKNKNSFEALLCALSAYYYSKKEVEKLPAAILHKGQKFALPYETRV